MRRVRTDQRGAALVIVLVLVIVLTLIGMAMVNLTLTESRIAFNQSDATSARDLADAGLSRAVSALHGDPTWSGATETLGDGQYVVSVVSSGTTRYVTSVGTKGLAQQTVRAAYKVIPRSAISAIFTNTIANPIGAGTTGLTINNPLPMYDATAVRANDALGSGTAMTLNTAGAVITGGLTASSAISGVVCSAWAWRCETFAAPVSFPRIDADSGSASSLRELAKATTDPVDGKNLYFKAGDAASRCKSGLDSNGYTWNFGLGQTQQCWDKYVSTKSGSLGGGMTNPVFYVEFGSCCGNEATSYTVIGTTAPSYSAQTSNSNGGGGATTLSINAPASAAANTVLIAAITVVGGSAATVTPPSGWNLVNSIDNGSAIKQVIYCRVTTSSETTPYVWTFDTTRKASGGIMRFTGVDTLAPIDVFSGQTTLSGTSHTVPSITTTVANTRLVASLSLATSSNFTAPTGMTERFDVSGGGGTGTTTEGAEQLQSTAGVIAAKTTTSGAAAVGITHILALRPTGATRVDCVGYISATRSFCLRSRAATDTGSTVRYANSDLRTVNGSVVVFTRGTGTVVSGDIVFEDLSVRTADYSHTSTSNPAFLAGGKFELSSSASPAAARTMTITGLVYTFGGADNPNVNGYLQGNSCSGACINLQHGAALVTVNFYGVLMTNGNVIARDTATNTGTITITYSLSAINSLPSPFLSGSTDNILVPVAWSNGN